MYKDYHLPLLHRTRGSALAAVKHKRRRGVPAGMRIGMAFGPAWYACDLWAAPFHATLYITLRTQNLEILCHSMAVSAIRSSFSGRVDSLPKVFIDSMSMLSKMHRSAACDTAQWAFMREYMPAPHPPAPHITALLAIMSAGLLTTAAGIATLLLWLIQRRARSQEAHDSPAKPGAVVGVTRATTLATAIMYGAVSFATCAALAHAGLVCLCLLAFPFLRKYVV